MLRFQGNTIGHPGLPTDFRSVISSLQLPALAWTAEDIFIIASANPGFDVAELERRSSTPGELDLVLDDAGFALVVAATDQFVDGEFIGFDPDRVGHLRDAVIRLDMLDGSFWTIILDPDRVGVREDFTRVFGPGQFVPAITSRAGATAGGSPS
jgi:hypothetical protein